MKNLFKTGISIVIPTYNDATILEKTLASLTKQTLDFALFEVIVADDGSSDETKEVVQKYSDILNLKYCFQSDKGFRVAHVRNLGLSYATFSRTLFLDTGMLVASNLLESHLSHHLAAPDVTIIGLSYGVEEYSSTNAKKIKSLLIEQDIDASFSNFSTHPELWDCRYQYLKSINFELRNMPAPWCIFWTGHVSSNTELLLQLGGFDEWFSSWGGEDVELGIRLYKSGCPFIVLPSMQSLNYPHLRDASAKTTTAINNIKYIYRKHACEETRMMLKHPSWLDLIKKLTIKTPHQKIYELIN
jgi:glycosyltransferase involved in cell wall biosynthesis